LYFRALANSFARSSSLLSNSAEFLASFACSRYSSAEEWKAASRLFMVNIKQRAATGAIAEEQGVLDGKAGQAVPGAVRALARAERRGLPSASFPQVGRTGGRRRWRDRGAPYRPVTAKQ
jgi:hypothetical protein